MKYFGDNSLAKLIALIKDTLSAHTDDTSIHVTAAEKEAWNDASANAGKPFVIEGEVEILGYGPSYDITNLSKTQAEINAALQEGKQLILRLDLQGESSGLYDLPLTDHSVVDETTVCTFGAYAGQLYSALLFWQGDDYEEFSLSIPMESYSVNVSEDADGNLCPGQSTDQIYAAWLSGARVFVQYGNKEFNLSEVVLDSGNNVKKVVFTYLGVNDTGAASLESMTISSDDTVQIQSPEISSGKPKATLVTLAAASWDASTKTQTVDVTGIDADESKQAIYVMPYSADAQAYKDAGIQMSAQAAGKATFICSSVPDGAVKVWVVVEDVEDVTPPPPPCLTFSSPSAFTISAQSPHWDGTMEYSTDNSTWGTWTGAEISSVANGDTHMLYVRGAGNTRIGIFGQGTDHWTLTGSNISCSGNIETLLDYVTVAKGEHPTMAEGCFYGLFAYCYDLIAAPDLPTTALSERCYGRMFDNCTSLTTAPALPATTLADYCYEDMFYGCTSLATAPALPAMELARSCYSAMFGNCTSLTVTPTLPATTLADYCYVAMFASCTGLTTAPALPAMKLAAYCYASMFRDCTNLATAPAILATTLPDYCCQKMFQGCTNLTTAADFQATTAGKYCCDHMFNGCTSLTAAPALPATALAEYCYSEMFDGCKSLTAAPTLPATTLASYCYSYMFFGCDSLTTTPVMLAATLADYCCQYMFYKCGNLTTASELPATTLASNCYSNMFRECTSLATAPTLPATTMGPSCYDSMFYSCTNLTTAPALPATALAVYCYSQMFSGCTSLTAAPELPATTLVAYCYEYMFDGCTSLTSAPALQATTLADYCYYRMFRRCTSLSAVSSLPATTLASYCYADMFDGCTSLTTVHDLPATTLTRNCYNMMYYGCTNIKLSSSKTGNYTQEYRVPVSGTGATATNALLAMFWGTGGTFTSDPTINTTYYLDASNTIV